MQREEIIGAVGEIYAWIGEQIANEAELCAGCGDCCEFEKYGHRLYVTAPEMVYLAAGIGMENLKHMETGRCPWQIDNKCTVHQHRFAGCRIFFCKGDSEKQAAISEEAIKRLKHICDQFGIEYHYMDLKRMLDSEFE